MAGATAASPLRLRRLDLLRGLAVLGILTVNIAAFADVSSAAYVPRPGGVPSPADSLAFAATLVLFEGKMRGLFSILFGASLLLFVDRAEAAGRPGARLQMRRLGWLALFGYLHFLLLWEGDILFLYAVAGFLALAFRHAGALPLAAAGLLVFTSWQAWGSSLWIDHVRAEAAAAQGSASPAQARLVRETIEQRRREDAGELERLRGTWPALVRHRLTEDPLRPLRLVFYTLGETLGYVLIGMALLRSGFLTGGWPRRQLSALAWGGTMLGGAASLAFASWAAWRGWPEMAMHLAINFALGLPHLLMTLGYAAVLMRIAPRLLQTRAGQKLEAAGRMALSNYLGTSLAMTALFHGWGLGLVGQYGPLTRVGFVVLGWALMLGCSTLWLGRFRQGPLEWLWRSLTEGRWLPLAK